MKKDEALHDYEMRCIFSEFCRDMEFVMHLQFLSLSVMPGIMQLLNGSKIQKIIDESGSRIDSHSNEKIVLYEVPIFRHKEITRLFDHIYPSKQSKEFLGQNILIGLIAKFDNLIGKILACSFQNNPNIMKYSDQTFSLTEILEQDSYEEFRNKAIEKLVEGILRKNKTEQFTKLGRIFGLKLTEQLESFPKFIEVCERRNLVAHTGGIVSSTYIEKCRNAGLDTQVSVGNKLHVDLEYLKKSNEVIFEIGAKLIYVIWAKTAKNTNSADAAMVNLIHECTSNGFRRVGHELAKFFAILDKSDELKKINAVNLAIFEKMNENASEVIKILDEHDWSASAPRFRICVAAVREEHEELCRLMKKQGDNGDLHEQDYRSWSAFRTMRDRSKFEECFETIFGSAYS